MADLHLSARFPFLSVVQGSLIEALLLTLQRPEISTSFGVSSQGCR